MVSGCVRDGVDECPEGSVRLNFFAERFRNRSLNPLDDREDIFTDRIGHFRYYLYKDGVLNKQGMIEKFEKATINSYSMEFSQLEYGEYEMVVVANCTKTALSGDAASSANLVLTYPGCGDTEDFFSAVFPFTVNSAEKKEYDIGLLRAHGVIRYTFVNMPSDISDIDIVMENVSSEKWITGDYKNIYKASQRYIVVPLNRQTADEEGYIMGTFPTLPDGRSSYYLNLYRQGETEPFRSELISDNLTIARNQLLDIAVTFNNGNISYEILLDSSWNGSSSGGATEIQ